MVPSIDPTTDVRTLVVDDEKEVADAYALRLRDVCDTRTAYTGREALETVETSAIDVVLLDRHMPSMSGDQVLERLRERSFPGRVIMVTAVDPDFAVIDMPFDDYLCKPVERADLHAAVDHQRQVLAYETLGEYFSAESKRSVLAAELPTEEREANEEYTALESRVERLRDRAERLLGDEADPFAEFRAISREEV